MRIAVAVAASAWLIAGGFQSPEAVAERDRQRLLSHLDMTAAWLADEVAGLSAAQLAFHPAADEWSIAEVVEHLVLVSEIYWQNLQDALKTRLKPGSTEKSRMTDADVLWYGIDRAWRDPAIPTERPAGKLTDVGAAMGTYRTRHDRLRQYIATTRDDLRAHFVQRQGCDAYQWALLISTHEQRHIQQIREIKRDPKFPKK